jgi:hypothetical protein
VTNATFTPEEERVLVGICIGFSSRKMSLSIIGLLTIISSLNQGTTVSARWVKRFINRHSKYLRLSRKKVLAKKRFRISISEEVRLFLDHIQPLIDLGILDAAHMLNTDEKRVGTSPDGQKIIAFQGAVNNNDLGARGEAICSIMPVISSDGTHLLTAYAWKASPDNLVVPVEIAQYEAAFGEYGFPLDPSEQIVEFPVHYHVASETGYFNSESFALVSEELASLLEVFGDGKTYFLFMDCLGFAYSARAVCSTTRPELADYIFSAADQHLASGTRQCPLRDLQHEISERVQCARLEPHGEHGGAAFCSGFDNVQSRTRRL